MRSLLALTLSGIVLWTLPAAAQDAVPVAASDMADDSEEGHRRHIVVLREELAGISLSGPRFAMDMGVQILFYACLATTVGSIMEVFSQELSERWRFDAPPWFAIGGAIAGFALASIGVPVLTGGALESGHRERRRAALEREIAAHEAALGLTVSPSPDGLTLAVTGTF